MPSGNSSPIQHYYDLADLSEAGDEIAVAAMPADLTRLAEWADVASVESFLGIVTLQRLSPSRFLYRAVLDADVVQNCVVSLEPVRSHLERKFSRILQVIPRSYRREADDERGGVLAPATGDDEVPEEIESYRYDLAAPLLEEFSLGITPYPRAPGVEFSAPADFESEKSPFAVLGRLKEKKKP